MIVFVKEHRGEMNPRRVNARRLTDRPRRSVAKWIQPPPTPDGTPPIRPGCWWSCVGMAFAAVIVVFLIVRWIA